MGRAEGKTKSMLTDAVVGIAIASAVALTLGWGALVVLGQPHPGIVGMVGFSALVIAAVAAINMYGVRENVRRIRGFTGQITAMTAGDLTQHVPEFGRDELALLARELNLLADGYRVSVGSLSTTAEVLVDASGTMARMGDQVADATVSTRQQLESALIAAQQAAEDMQMVMTGAETLDSSITDISRNVNGAAAVATRAAGTAQETIQLVSELKTSSVEIGDVVKIINMIAEQTHLLALNASMEAARAGASGKGFAVVADEVKTLAAETAQATKDIENLVRKIQQNSEGAGNAIAEIGAVVVEISEHQTSIAAAVEEQAVTANRMSDGVRSALGSSAGITSGLGSVLGSADQTSGVANEAAGSAAGLVRIAAEMHDAVSGYHV